MSYIVHDSWPTFVFFEMWGSGLKKAIYLPGEKKKPVVRLEKNKLQAINKIYFRIIITLICKIILGYAVLPCCFAFPICSAMLNSVA